MNSTLIDLDVYIDTFGKVEEVNMVGYLMILLFRGTQCEPLKFQRTFTEWEGLPEKPLLRVSPSRVFFFSISYIFMCATKRYAFSTQLFWSELNNVSCSLKPEFGIRCLFFIPGLSRSSYTVRDPATTNQWVIFMRCMDLCIQRFRVRKVSYFSPKLDGVGGGQEDCLNPTSNEFSRSNP